MNTSNDLFIRGLTVPDQQKLVSWATTKTSPELQRLIAQPRPEGFALELSIQSVEELRLAFLPDHRWFKVQLAAETAHAVTQDYDRLFPLLQKGITIGLLQRTFDTLHLEDSSPVTVSLWHKLLIEQLKVAVGHATKESTSPDEQQERIWDIFAVPEAERAKRRAKNKKN